MIISGDDHPYQADTRISPGAPETARVCIIQIPWELRMKSALRKVNAPLTHTRSSQNRYAADAGTMNEKNKNQRQWSTLGKLG